MWLDLKRLLFHLKPLKEVKFPLYPRSFTQRYARFFSYAQNQSDLVEGELRETNNPLDMALRGDGFFALNNAKGESVYTRNGQFYINSEGVMVNSMGHQFSDPAGGSITVEPDLGEVSIDKEGQVFQGEELIGEIGIFKFDDPLSQLERIGGGFIPKTKISFLNNLNLAVFL